MLVFFYQINHRLLNKYSGSALDGHFVEKGKAAGKIITPLETITEQMDLLFNQKTDEEQAYDLIQFMRNKKVNIRIGNDLLKSYFDNDLNAIQSLYKESLKISGDNDYLVKPRNAKWMKVLPALLIERSQFIAVGALHLSGPDGLVEQLKKQGYTITALKL